MTELEFNGADILEDDPSLPAYSDPGSMLFEIEYIDRSPREGWEWKYSVNFISGAGCAYWITEGEGQDYWVNQNIELDEEGFYVVEDIVGTYHRGDGWTTDDAIDWDFGRVRRATPKEIEGECIYE